MIIKLIKDAQEWLKNANMHDENWWALGGEGLGNQPQPTNQNK